MRSSRHVWAFAAALLVACGGPPQPGQAGYPFNVDGEYAGTVAVEGEGFASILRIRTSDGGAVSGTFEVTQPIRLSGAVSGRLVGDQLELTMRYSNNPMSGCDGEVDGTVTVEEGGATISGPMTVVDCGEFLGANVRFTRRGR